MRIGSGRTALLSVLQLAASVPAVARGGGGAGLVDIGGDWQMFLDGSPAVFPTVPADAAAGLAWSFAPRGHSSSSRELTNR